MGSLHAVRRSPSAAAGRRALDHGDRPWVRSPTNVSIPGSWRDSALLHPLMVVIFNISAALARLLADGAGLRLDGGLLLDRPSPRSYAAVERVRHRHCSTTSSPAHRLGASALVLLFRIGPSSRNISLPSQSFVLLMLRVCLGGRGARVLMLLAGLADRSGMGEFCRGWTCNFARRVVLYPSSRS